MAIEVYYLFILFICQESTEGCGLVKALIKRISIMLNVILYLLL